MAAPARCRLAAAGVLGRAGLPASLVLRCPGWWLVANTIAGVGASTAADPAKAGRVSRSRCPALRWQHRGRGVGFPFSPRGCFSAGGVPTITPPPAFYTHGQNLWPFGGADRPVIAACRGVSCPGWPALLCRTLALSRLALGGVGRAPRQLAAAVLVSGWAPFIGLRPSRVGYPAALV